jgi:hypothetical protein
LTSPVRSLNRHEPDTFCKDQMSPLTKSEKK